MLPLFVFLSLLLLLALIPKPDQVLHNIKLAFGDVINFRHVLISSTRVHLIRADLAGVGRDSHSRALLRITLAGSLGLITPD